MDIRLQLTMKGKNSTQFNNGWYEQQTVKFLSKALQHVRSGLLSYAATFNPFNDCLSSQKIRFKAMSLWTTWINNNFYNWFEPGYNEKDNYIGAGLPRTYPGLSFNENVSNCLP